MRLNWLGFIGLVALVVLAIWLCVKYIPGASDKVKDLVDNTTKQDQQEQTNQNDTKTITYGGITICLQEQC